MRTSIQPQHRAGNACYTELHERVRVCAVAVGATTAMHPGWNLSENCDQQQPARAVLDGEAMPRHPFGSIMEPETVSMARVRSSNNAAEQPPHTRAP